MVDFENLKTGVAEAIRAVVGTDLFQIDDPDSANPADTMGLVIRERAGKEAPILGYPYVTTDIVSIRDDDGFLNDEYFDASQDGIMYETVKLITFQLTVFSDDGKTLQICQKLETGFRRQDVIAILRQYSDMGIVDTTQPTSSPQFYDTDFVEQSFFLLEVRVYDEELVTGGDYAQAIERVTMQNTLERYPDDPSPLSVNIDTNNP